MPKRKSDDDSDEYIRRKMRKIEKKLRKRKRRSRRLSSSSSDSRINHMTPVPSLPEDGQELLITDSVASSQQLGLHTQDVDLEIMESLPGPSGSAPTVSDECTLDDDILSMLGASPNKLKKMGDKIQKDIALRWEHIATSGLTKDARKELLDKHLIPENCPKLSGPLLNPEIKAALSDIMIGKDKGTEHKQNQVASAIGCIGEALTKMFNFEYKDPSVIKPLLEGAQLLCDLQFSESMKRRSLICASIKKDIKGQLYETDIDTYLFGEKLADTLKAAKAINKSGSEMKLSKPKATTARLQSRVLNLKPQLATSRQPAKKRQEPASYTQMPTPFPPSFPPQRRQYPVLPAVLPPTLPPPPPPPLPLPPHQRPRQRPYQRR